MSEFDFGAAYTVEGWDGIAWRAMFYEKVREYTDHNDEEGMVDNEEWVVCHMIGDDAEYTFEVSSLTKIDETEYCPECGQIGCGAYNA